MLGQYKSLQVSRQLSAGLFTVCIISDYVEVYLFISNLSLFFWILSVTIHHQLWTHGLHSTQQRPLQNPAWPRSEVVSTVEVSTKFREVFRMF